MKDLTTGPVPRYHQVYLLLRQQILEGTWTPGTSMPGEHDLGIMQGVSRITIRKALGRLEADGLIQRKRGAGTFVNPLKGERRRENLQDLLENLLAMGLQTEVKLISFGYVPATPLVAEKLAVKIGAIVQKSVRIRLNQGVPFSHLTTWVPEDIGCHFRPEDLAEKPLLALLREAGFPPAKAEQIVSAKLAENVIAQLLNVEPASALLCVHRQVSTESGRPIEYIESMYRADLYEYKTGLAREGDLWSHHEIPASAVK